MGLAGNGVDDDEVSRILQWWGHDERIIVDGKMQEGGVVSSRTEEIIMTSSQVVTGAG